MFVFLNTMALLEGSDPKEKLNSAYWPALRANWYVWPAVQFVNFKYVPLDLRVLVVNIISLGKSFTGPSASNRIYAHFFSYRLELLP